MLADLGLAALAIAFAAAVYAIAAAIYSVKRAEPRWGESARNALTAVFPLVFLAAAMLVVSLLRGDFSLEYVWRVSSREMPTYLKVTALWGGQAGSLLFWNLLLAAFTAVAVRRDWGEYRPLMPYVIGVASLTQLFFLGISLFVENPFSRLATVPLDGNGLNPLLRHPGMIIHPPMLYLGFTGFTIPYAFAMAVLIANRLDDGWLRLVRRWTLIGWMFLSAGLILGGRWAYDVLGWGGYWAWDPVENASFMPWLAGTAFLHSVIIQEKRGMFRQWNMILILTTYLLVIYGTFIVRSGVISSVHSFAQSAIGPLFFGFLSVMLISSIYFIIKRWNSLGSDNQLHSYLSREAAFLLNNFVIMGILVATFWGTNYPIISELITDQQITVAEPFYEKVNGPLFAVLLLLMGVAPLTMYFRTSAQRLGRMMQWPAVAALIIVAALYFFGVHSWGALLGLWIVTFSAILTLLEFWRGSRARMRSKGESFLTALGTLIGRNRRRYGGYWIHLGILIMGFGIIGTEFYQQQTQIRLNRGESVALGRYEMTFNGVSQYDGPDDLIITEATLDVYDNGRYVKTLYPRTEFYTRTEQPMTIPDLRSTVSEDFYVLMVNWEGASADQATFRIFLNPLINWVWAGGLLLVIGTLIAAWPDPADEKMMAAAGRRTQVTVGATS